MSITKNNQSILEINKNGKPINEVYFGNKLVFAQNQIAEIFYKNLDEFGNLYEIDSFDVTNAFNNITKIGYGALVDEFSRRDIITGTLTFPNLKEVEEMGMYYAFESCYNLTGSLIFPELISVGKSGFSRAFMYTGLTSVSFPKLTHIGESGFERAFYDSSLQSIELPSLQSISNYGLGEFISETSVQTIKFPSLISATNQSFGRWGDAFKYCDDLREIHFRADARSVIENIEGYNEKFGATNATIYFDL